MHQDACEIFAKIAPSSLWLTANRRLALYWRKTYSAWQKTKGVSVWETLSIMPLDSYLISLWQEQAEDLRILLNNFQTQLIWENVVQNQNHSLLQITQTAQLLREALERLQLWQVPIQKIISENEEINFFLHLYLHLFLIPNYLFLLYLLHFFQM